MHFAGKQVGQHKALGIERKRLQQQFLFGAEVQGWVGVHFKLDLGLSAAFHLQVVHIRVVLEKGRDDRRGHLLFPLANLHIETQRRELLCHRIEIGGERKLRVGVQQGKIQIFREAWQAMEYAQAGAAIKCSLLKKSAALQPGQRNFLHDFAQRVGLLKLCTCLVWRQHLFDDAHRNPSMALSNSVSWRCLCPACAQA